MSGARVVRQLMVAACLLVVPACGVSSQDEPQLIEESTQPPSTATPSFATETSTPDASPEPTTSTTTPSSRPPG